MAHPEIHDDTIPPRKLGALPAFARVYWMLLGNLLVGVSAAVIAQAAPAPSIADALFWVSAAALVAVRYLDVARFGGRTADGEPATIGHWKRYSLLVGGICLLTWSAAHAVAWLLAR